jgi:hypothetical protein
LIMTADLVDCYLGSGLVRLIDSNVARATFLTADLIDLHRGASPVRLIDSNSMVTAVATVVILLAGSRAGRVIGSKGGRTHLRPSVATPESPLPVCVTLTRDQPDHGVS